MQVYLQNFSKGAFWFLQLFSFNAEEENSSYVEIVIVNDKGLLHVGEIACISERPIYWCLQ